MQKWASQNIGKELNKQVTPKLVWLIKWSKAGSLSWPGQDKIIKKWVDVLECRAESKSQPPTRGRCWELQKNIYESLFKWLWSGWFSFCGKYKILKLNLEAPVLRLRMRKQQGFGRSARLLPQSSARHRWLPREFFQPPQSRNCSAI